MSGRGRKWTAEEVEYLRINYGSRTIPAIAKHLNRTVKAVSIKRDRMRLGSTVAASGMIALNTLLEVIYNDPDHGNHMYTQKVACWKKAGLRIEKKPVIGSKVSCVNLDKFWKWAEGHQALLNFAFMPEGALGVEPPWMRQKRKIDTANTRGGKHDWTTHEDALLDALLKEHRYTAAQISERIGRSESSIRRHIYERGIRETPVYNEHRRWTLEEIQQVRELYRQGYKATAISERLNRPITSVYRQIQVAKEQAE